MKLTQAKTWNGSIGIISTLQHLDQACIHFALSIECRHTLAVLHSSSGPCHSEKAKIACRLAMQRNDSSKHTLDGPGTVLTDVIHLSSIVSVVLRNVSLADLASLAVCSKSCAAAMRPHCLKLRINRVNALHALRSLHRMACLDELEQATLHATEGDCTAGAYLGILGMCPNLQALTLVCRITSQHGLGQQVNQVESKELVALAEALPLHVTRTVKFTLCDKPHAPPLHHWVWHPTEMASMPGLRRD